MRVTSTEDDRAEEEGGGVLGLALLVAASVVAHAGLWKTLSHLDRPAAPARARAASAVTLEIAAPRAAPPAAVAAPPGPRAPARRVAARAPAAAPAPAPPPTAPEAETPADFSGVTLTNDGPGPGWNSAVGNGDAMHGPLGAPGAKVTGRSGAGSGAAATQGPPVVALGSLSRPPAPPDLGDVLERHYPELARQRGLSGEAVLKARIMPDGRARDLVLVSQSAGGFGDACRATLRESVWTAPLDRQGRAVATLVSYTCRFEVR